jgi:cholestenol delta-isomerase
MAAHPYSPAGLDLPGYVPQRLSQLEILGPYLGTSLFVLLAVWLLSGKHLPWIPTRLYIPSVISSRLWFAGRCSRLSKVDRLLMCWWAFTGLTHLVVEGSFVFTPDFFSKENPSYFDESSKFTSRLVSHFPSQQHHCFLSNYFSAESRCSY